ncbi:MAG: hypothetical protein CAK90_02020 [Spartobacteria bacterium AMD-G4]|nr:MAG: hypothetical protein CAK90_02020 [Spartobacteria bacterium AMD-G4]
MSATALQPPSKPWMLLGGVLSILVGFCAIAAPALFSYIITAFIGALCLVSGLIGLFQAFFGTDTAHRILSIFSAVIRMAAGAVLFLFTESGMETLTLLLGAVFFAEGIACIIISLRLHANSAWIWLFLNGVVALVLGGLVYARWPIDSEWVIGVLYGIQSLFSGVAMLMLGLSVRKQS